MLTFVSGLVLAVLMLLAATLDKTYSHIPLKELKCRARQGDQQAKALHRPAAYGLNAHLLLVTFAVVAAAFSFLFFALALKSWLAFLFIVGLVWWGFILIPSGKLTDFGRRLGIIFSPTVVFMLHYLHPLLEPLGQFVNHYYPHNASTGLYDSEDILNLLEWQKEQPDNRLSPEQIETAARALNFGNKRVSDAMLASSSAKLVGVNESIGPVLIDELHKTGRDRFLVFEGKKDNIVGTIYLEDALKQVQKGGSVGDITRHDVRFVHEDFALNRALAAFLKTKQDTLVVINRFEEFVGVLSLQDVLAEIINQPAEDKFDAYQDRQAVAQAQLAEEPVTVEETDEEPVNDQPTEDVVE